MRRGEGGHLLPTPTRPRVLGARTKTLWRLGDYRGPRSKGTKVPGKATAAASARGLLVMFTAPLKVTIVVVVVDGMASVGDQQSSVTT